METSAVPKTENDCVSKTPYCLGGLDMALDAQLDDVIRVAMRTFNVPAATVNLMSTACVCCPSSLQQCVHNADLASLAVGERLFSSVVIVKAKRCSLVNVMLRLWVSVI